MLELRSISSPPCWWETPNTFGGHHASFTERHEVCYQIALSFPDGVDWVFFEP
jgi:hypothetical protein